MERIFSRSIIVLVITVMFFTSAVPVCSDNIYAASKKRVKITFVANGGEVSKSSKTVYAMKKYGKLPKPKRKGYTFKGWYTKKKKGKKVTSKTKIIKRKNHKLYAHWEKKIDYVKYSNEVMEMINSEREKAGGAPLSIAGKLNGYANIRAQEISVSFSHIRPDGSKFCSLAPKLIRGENIAWGQRNPSHVMDTLMKSEAHKDVMLTSDFKKMGIGIYKKSGVIYWALLFSY